ncbi:hypothetical protein GCM10009592_14640 [Brachybacterium rhamnosum]|uniref:HK97 gp10 family phage protein n=1 Tax=Brachybacterium rhamnosum TaxID=173361 RepID=A0ABW4PY00_9MICO
MAKEVVFKAGVDVTKAVQDAAAHGLALAAEYLLEAANRTVPLEEGTLQRSGRASVDDDGLRAAVSYDTPYAIPVHEDLTARHDAGRRAKWLELAMQEEADTIRQIIVDAIKEQT